MIKNGAHTSFMINVRIARFKDGPMIREECGIRGPFFVEPNEISCCKLICHPECMELRLWIPPHEGTPHKCIRIVGYLKENMALFLTDDENGKLLLEKVMNSLVEEDTMTNILDSLFQELLSKERELLEKKERSLSNREQLLLDGRTYEFWKWDMEVRREILDLREYYQELADVIGEMQPQKESRDSLERICTKCEKLEQRTDNLLNQMGLIRETYRAIVAEKQNKNMNTLTVISMVFLPLNVITGWFGMNFHNMPELEHGYPYVVAVCVILILLILWFFKKNRFL